MKYRVLPLATSEYSLKSLIQLKDKDKKTPDSINLFSCAEKYLIDPIYLVDKNMSGFYKFVKGCEAVDATAAFGWKAVFCNDIADDSEQSKKTEHEMIVFVSSSDGYERMCRLHSAAAISNAKGYARVDENLLRQHWSDKDLVLAIPFYGSFLHRNCLTNDSEAQYCYDWANPTFMLEDNGIPFDGTLRREALKFAAKYKNETQEAQTIYYEKYQDAEAYQALCCKNKRTSLEKPNLDYFCSDTFCFEHWELKNNE